MTTLVLLDTNTYLRLAKRVRPFVGLKFGQVPYLLAIHKVTEDEVHRNPHLRYKNPWFDGPEFAEERLAKQVRLTKDEKAQIDAAQSVLMGWVQMDVSRFTSFGRSPPGYADCWLLAFGQVRPAVVATDDLGMHELAKDFKDIKVWHGYELLAKLKTAKAVDDALIREIYQALEANGDMTKTWEDAKHKVFKKSSVQRLLRERLKSSLPQGALQLHPSHRTSVKSGLGPNLLQRRSPVLIAPR